MCVKPRLAAEPLRLLVRPGIVGAGFRKAIVTRHRLRAGDCIAVHSDGVSPRFELEPFRGRSPAAVAHHLVETFRRPNDDACCLVIML